jgi:hypothetical protein
MELRSVEVDIVGMGEVGVVSTRNSVWGSFDEVLVFVADIGDNKNCREVLAMSPLGAYMRLCRTF